MLPKEIYPNPLLAATVEIRFKSTLNPANLLSTVYPKYIDTFPSLKEGKIPKEIKEKDDRFKFSPDFSMSNDDYTVNFSNQVFSFESSADYKLWDNYSSFIYQQLDRLREIGIVEKVERIGVRYVSMFEGATPLNQIFKNVPSSGVKGYVENSIFHIFDLVPEKNDKYRVKLQIAKEAKAVKNGEQKVGVLIDIDSSLSNYNSELDTKVYQIIDDLHSCEKDLFFSLLTPSFLSSLNPKY